MISELSITLTKAFAVEGDINHLAFSTLIEAATRENGTAAVQIIDDEVAHLFNLIRNNKSCLVALYAFHHQVDNLALDEDKDDGINGQTERQ